jgi:cyclic pyranopterin phosphate synthase
VKFVASWRRCKSAAFDLERNSTARRTVQFSLWDRPVRVYANANLSVYSAERCNAACPFCVEELRPASRGVELVGQKRREDDDVRYFDNLSATFDALAPFGPTLSITGGEPSKDPRLPEIVKLVSRAGMRKRTLTTNGSGLLDRRGGRRVIDWICDHGFNHLNISVAHPDPARNSRLMQLAAPLSLEQLQEVVRVAAQAGLRVRLSCILQRASVATLADVRGYLDFARSIGADNVIFRQLMKSDPQTQLANSVVRYSDQQRVPLEPLLDEISSDKSFQFERQIVGYYYYVEVWRYGSIGAVFEEANLAQLETVKRRDPETIHELIFHPSGTLNSTWQPWDGILGPPERPMTRSGIRENSDALRSSI